MKTKTSMPKQVQILGGFLRRVATAIVSGLPRKKVFLKPTNATIFKGKEENFRPDNEKHYHHPVSKPIVEKQTLLKETKKPKASH